MEISTFTYFLEAIVFGVLIFFFTSPPRPRGAV